MEVRARCEACGAALVIPETLERLYCTACGAALIVRRGEGYVALQVARGAVALRPPRPVRPWRRYAAWAGVGLLALLGLWGLLQVVSRPGPSAPLPPTEALEQPPAAMILSEDGRPLPTPDLQAIAAGFSDPQLQPVSLRAEGADLQLTVDRTAPQAAHALTRLRLAEQTAYLTVYSLLAYPEVQGISLTVTLDGRPALQTGLSRQAALDFAPGVFDLPLAALPPAQLAQAAARQRLLTRRFERLELLDPALQTAQTRPDPTAVMDELGACLSTARFQSVQLQKDGLVRVRLDLAGEAAPSAAQNALLETFYGLYTRFAWILNLQVSVSAGGQPQMEYSLERARFEALGAEYFEPLAARARLEAIFKELTPPTPTPLAAPE